MKRPGDSAPEGGQANGVHERTDEEAQCVAFPLEEGLLKFLRHAAHRTQVQMSCAVQAYEVRLYRRFNHA
jgi:hypothetical protein